MTAIFLCFGDADECQCCGGSASLNGTQEPLRTDIGIYCSTDCHDEIREFSERQRWARSAENCRVCGFDRCEHQHWCPPMLRALKGRTMPA